MDGHRPPAPDTAGCRYRHVNLRQNLTEQRMPQRLMIGDENR